jgi:hypothetical protein
MAPLPRRGLVALGLGAALPGPAAAQRLALEASAQPSGPFRRDDFDMVGVFDADWLTEPRIVRMLDTLAASPGAVGAVRVFGVLNAGTREMDFPTASGGTWTDSAEPPDFTAALAALEAQVGRGLVPFLALGFFPKAVSPSPVLPPPDLGPWRRLVRDFPTAAGRPADLVKLPVFGFYEMLRMLCGGLCLAEAPSEGPAWRVTAEADRVAAMLALTAGGPAAVELVLRDLPWPRADVTRFRIDAAAANAFAAAGGGRAAPPGRGTGRGGAAAAGHPGGGRAARDSAAPRSAGGGAGRRDAAQSAAARCAPLDRGARRGGRRPAPLDTEPRDTLPRLRAGATGAAPPRGAAAAGRALGGHGAARTGAALRPAGCVLLRRRQRLGRGAADQPVNARAAMSRRQKPSGQSIRSIAA